MIEKNVQEARIRKGPPKRNPVCYQVVQDIVIPAGTMLRDASVYRGSMPEMATNVNLAPGVDLYISVDDVPATCAGGYFRKVISV